MASSNDFFDFVQDQLSPWSQIDKKRMFGVLGLYREGLMFGVIAKNMVYLKVNESNKPKFIAAGSSSLKVFKNNSEVPSFYEVPVDILENGDEFIKWAKESFEIQVIKNSN